MSALVLHHSIRFSGHPLPSFFFLQGYVGVTLVNGTLMKGSDGAFRMHPTSLPSYTIIKITDYSPLLNHYDLTRELYTQISGLTTYRSVTNRYVYYGATT